MTNYDFDIAIIGSGPSSIAVTMSIGNKSHKIAWITGSANKLNHQSKRTHPKILSTAVEMRETPGINNPINFQGTKSGLLADTAIKGGLTNYWGQQFLRYEIGDNWCHGPFDSYSEYLNVCRKIEDMFTLSNNRSSKSLHNGDYLIKAPKLLLGSKKDPKSGLFTFRHVVDNLANNHGVTLINNILIKWVFYGTKIKLIFLDGSFLFVKKLILAAGVLGTLRILMRSCPEVRSVKFSDHSPLLLYFASWNDIFGVRNSNNNHINSVTLERIEHSKIKLFASLYNLKFASLGLMLSNLGLPPLFASIKLPSHCNFILPIQVWTEQSLINYEFKHGSLSAIANSCSDKCSDVEFKNFEAFLLESGMIVHQSITSPGFGFHYHNGKVSLDGEFYQKISNFLENNFGNYISCLDSSLISQISPRPHTLTLMANIYRISNQIV